MNWMIGSFDRVRVSFLAILALALATPTLASEPTLDPAAIKAWQDYEVFAKTIQGSLQRKTTSLVSGSVRSYPIYYKQNATSALLHTSLSEPNSEFCFIANPRYTAEIKRHKEGGGELLRKYDLNPLAILPGESLPVGEGVFVGTSPHYCYGDQRLSEVINDPNFKILRVERVSQDGRNLVRIEYTSLIDIPGGVKQQSKRRGSMDLDPELGWSIRAIKESEDYFMRDILDHKSDWDIRYEAERHPLGFPIMRRRTDMMTGFSNRLNKKIGAKIEVEYNLTTDTHVPDSEFTLSAFNLPEPIDRPAPRSSNLYLWLCLAAAALCAVLAIFFRWLSRRGTQSQAVHFLET